MPNFLFFLNVHQLFVFLRAGKYLQDAGEYMSGMIKDVLKQYEETD